MDQTRKGYLLIVGTALCFGVNGIALRLFYRHFGSYGTESIAFWSLLSATLLITPVYLSSGIIRQRLVQSLKQNGKVIVFVALLSSSGAYLWFLALHSMGAGPVSLLAKSQILTSTILGMIILKERFTAFEVAGLLLSLPGVFLVSTLPDEVPLEGALYILFSAALYGLQSLIVKRFAPGLLGKEFTYIRAWVMSVLFGIFFSATGGLEVLPVSIILILGLISLTGLMLGRSLYFEAHNYLPISKLSTGMLIEPVFVLTASFVVLDEPLGLSKLAGAGLILLGLWMVARKNLGGFFTLQGPMKRFLLRK